MYKKADTSFLPRRMPLEASEKPVDAFPEGIR